jgi:hypothetical protein
MRRKKEEMDKMKFGDRQYTPNEVASGLHPRYIAFLEHLGGILANYDGFGKATPFNESIGAKFRVKLLKTGHSCPGDDCWDPINEEWYCC